MHLKTIKTILFVIWVVAIAVLSIIPHADGGVSFKLTESGIIKHFVAYFVGTALFFLAFRKRPQITQITQIVFLMKGAIEYADYTD